MKIILKKRLVLASNSPRRIALLKMLGYHFDVIPHNIEECFLDNVLPAELVQNLAFLKASDVARRVDNAIIISADTIVVQEKKILGKPRDTQDARRILSLLSASEHDILSGVCIIDMPSKKKLLRIDRTHIKIKYISENEIEMYVKSGEPMDKAGAYAVQGEGKKFIEKMEGSYSNAIGLPLEIVQEMLNNFIGTNNPNAKKL
ncbi:MAG: septum formation protein Maf [Candidatus Brocadia sp.]|nr:septum formation protein Maf [Candidatus Brocadia sp.]